MRAIKGHLDRQYREVSVTLTETESDRLVKFSREIDATLTTVLFAAWALLLSAANDKNDVVFGAAFSGRPAELDDVEDIVGPFVNDVPVRVKIEPDQTVLDMLRALRLRQFEITQHQQTPLETIQECSSISWRHRLFESLMVVQNYVSGEISGVFGKDIVVEKIVGNVRTNYPMTIVVDPAEQIKATFISREGILDGDVVSDLAQVFKHVLVSIPSFSNQPVSALLQKIPQTMRVCIPEEPTTAKSGDGIKMSRLRPSERKLFDIWHGEYQMTEMALDDSWADHGIQSALILKVHRRISEEFNRDLSIAKMYEFSTIRNLAEFLDGNSKSDDLSVVESRARKARFSARRRVRTKGERL
jgi:hypothetical protein